MADDPLDQLVDVVGPGGTLRVTRREFEQLRSREGYRPVAAAPAAPAEVPPTFGDFSAGVDEDG